MASIKQIGSKAKHESVATPPGERGKDTAAVGMGEGAPEAVPPHPAQTGTEPKTAYRASKVQRARGKNSADLTAGRVLRASDAAAKLSPELPEALRRLAGDDRVLDAAGGARRGQPCTELCCGGGE